MRADHEGPKRRHQDRVAVGRGALGLPGAQRAARSGLVLDHEGGAKLLLQLGRDRAGDEVRRTARRERHDHRDGLGRPVLRLGRSRDGQAKCERGEPFFHASLL